jgi:hypothetical protein
MKKLLLDWYATKWQFSPPIAQDFQAVFGSESGKRVMAWMMDNVYCTVYTGNDPIVAAHHTGRRSVVHEMLELLDQIENPRKAYFNPKVEVR